jgi:preprotein translocase subunit YajC
MSMIKFKLIPTYEFLIACHLVYRPKKKKTQKKQDYKEII